MTPVFLPPGLRLRSPTDILAVTPYVVGFHPDESLVGLGLDDTRLTFFVRADLPPEGASRALVDEVARRFVELFEQQGMTGAVLVGYGSPQRVGPVVATLRRQLLARQIELREALRAADGRWWSYLCADPECCSLEGTPYDVASTVIAAMATVAGRVVLPDRESVMRSLDPPTGPALHAFEEAFGRARDRLCRLVDCSGDGPDDRSDERASELPAGDASAGPAGERGGRFADGVASADRSGERAALLAAGERAVTEACECYGRDGRLSDDDLAWLCLLVQLVDIRNAVWRRIEDERDGLTVHEHLWSDALRRCDPELAAPIGVLLAFAFWRDGEGLRATVAIQRALAADPTCEAARLMSEVLQRGLPPRPRRQRKPRARARRRRKR